MSGRERSLRVGDQIQSELADIFRRRMKNPLPGLVTVTGVEVSPDLRHATVFISALNEPDLDTAIKSLVHARGFLRSELGRRLRLRLVPDLRFLPDRSVEEAMRIQELLNELRAKGEFDPPEES
jgi:ribosome-binding factor A